MNTCISIPHSKPQNLSSNSGENIAHLKPWPASIKQQVPEWAKACRNVTSATLKSNSFLDADFESAEDRGDLREQIELFKQRNQLKGRRKGSKTAHKYYEASSDKENDSEMINLSPMNSVVEIQEKEKRIKKLELQIQTEKRETEKERKLKEQTIADKDFEIERLQQMVQNLRQNINEDSEGMIEQINQLNIDKSILTEELHKTIETLEVKNNEIDVIQQVLNEKVKIVEEKAQRDAHMIKQGFLEKIDELEREKNDLTRALVEAKESVERSDKDSDSVRNELYQIIQKLQDERQALFEKLEDNENIVRSSLNEVKSKEAEIQVVKEKMQKEISVLEYELNECKLESLSYINELKEQNMSLRESFNNLDDEKYKLEEKFAEYIEKFDCSLKEIEDLRACKEKHATQESEALDRIQIEQKLTIEKEVIMMKLEQSERAYNQQIFELEETLASKDQYIKGLLSEINQLKNVIEEKHKNVSEEKESSENKELIKELEEIQEKEEFEEKELVPKTQDMPEKQTEVAEQSAEGKEEAPNKTIIYYIQKPRYQYRNYYDKHSTLTKDQRSSYSSRQSREQIVYKPKLPHLNIDKDNLLLEDQSDLRSASSQTPRSATKKKEISKDLKNERLSRLYRRPREEDPVYKQLEKMVMDLNDKLFTSDKRAKQFYEEKLKELSAQQLEKQEHFLTEIERLKNEKLDLLRKIDDIQWEKAYEYTEKARFEKENKPIETNKKIQEDVKRKKKNNKSIHISSLNDLKSLLK